MKRGLLLLLAVELGACAKPEEAPPPPRPVLVQTVRLSPTTAVNAYNGDVRARHEADLGFRIGGKLIERRVDIGANVRRGQVLARLDPQDAALSARAAAAQRAAVETDLALAQAEYDRALGLKEKNFISGSVLDARRSALEAATSRLQQARAQSDLAANQSGYTTLTADRDGVVTAILAEPGQVVAAGQPVARIAQPGAREVLIHVPESRIAGLRIGGAAQVRPWAAAERAYPGEVREIAPAADVATRTYAVRVAVSGADEALPLGATASVVISGTAAEVIRLPLPTVTQQDGRSAVWVVDAASGRVEPRPVEVMAWREESALVASGVTPGERVVVAGVHKLTAGEVVRPVDAAAPIALDSAR